ncbi:MAG: hypothetical protein Q8P41_16815 [Pseudomonadota bacterium]|nr:hypothetical protein [Pseudomonadota bacterium]
MLLLLFLACAGAPADDTGEPSLEPTLTNVQAEVFTASCAFSSCHGGSGGGAADLDLTDGVSHAELVGIESTDAPGEILVVAGDSAASYLVKKSAALAGIVGEPMPDGDADGLDADRLALLTAWIDAGALDD